MGEGRGLKRHLEPKLTKKIVKHSRKEEDLFGENQRGSTDLGAARDKIGNPPEEDLRKSGGKDDRAPIVTGETKGTKREEE